MLLEIRIRSVVVFESRRNCRYYQLRDVLIIRKIHNLLYKVHETIRRATAELEKIAASLGIAYITTSTLFSPILGA